jgi:hypothetical protein
MPLTETEALHWVARFGCISVALQTLEYLYLRSCSASSNIFTWSILQRDFQVFPKLIQKIFYISLNDQVYPWLLRLQLITAVFVFIHPSPLLFPVLLITTLLNCLRWRGTFNGGSDFITLTVWIGLVLSTQLKDSPSIQKAGLWYIALQSCTSYFLAGMIKLRTRSWRNGEALRGFLNSTIYDSGPVVSRLTSPQLFLWASWLIILFESSFPFSLLSPSCLKVFIGAALLFHLANSYFFGLNRFLFAWASTYPALFFCSQNHLEAISRFLPHW